MVDSTVLRTTGTVIAYSLLAYESTLKGLRRLQANEGRMAEDIHHAWEVLAEAVQTVMRRFFLFKTWVEKGYQMHMNRWQS